MNNDTKISVRDLNLYYGENHALKNINMDIHISLSLALEILAEAIITTLQQT